MGEPQEYGRGLGGQRVIDYKSGKTRLSVALIGAICVTGIVGLLYGEWTTTGDIFSEFIRTQVVPKLRPGQMVVMDNATYHKVKEVKEAIEKAGAKLVFLPPYSPDFSPIEKMWSKLKQHLRRLPTQTKAKYHNSLVESLNTLNEEDFESWYDHCGYSVNYS